MKRSLGAKTLIVPTPTWIVGASLGHAFAVGKEIRGSVEPHA
jgi:hypothetical protein